MAFLPSLQESVQPNTGGVLFFQTEKTQNKSLEENISSDLSIVLQDALLGHHWEKVTAQVR